MIAMGAVAIIDYGVGNLFSLSSSLSFIGQENVVTRDKKTIESADRIILPGVGAFGDAMDKLLDTGLVPTLEGQVRSGKPFLGICLGMQLLFERSFEYGLHNGLGYIKGDVCPLTEDFNKAGIKLKVPQMGWNSLNILKPGHPLMKYTKQGDFVYFVHSFYAKDCVDAVVADVSYGVGVPAVVAHDNVCGCQFHPEKSGAVGLDILRAFAQM
jgi:glutamine amidotransferase